MRVLIASTYVPFIKGGGTKIIDDLHAQFTRRGYDAQTVMIPLYSSWRDLPEQTVALRLLDLTEAAGNRVDLLVAVRYPSYALRHPNKVAWFLHHHREAYDLWGTKWSCIPDSAAGTHFRDMTRQADDQYLGECQKVFAISGVVADRIRRMNARAPDGVLYPPLSEDHPFRPGPSNDYFVYPGRMNPIKRQQLAIEAMRYTYGSYRLEIIGKSDVPQFETELRTQIRDLGLESRVQLLGWVSEEKKAERLTGCCGCLNIPFDEDYGYVTLEAFYSHKPLITCTDSGGPTEFVQDGHNGFVVEPSPQALADAMDRMWYNQQQTRDMGAAARRTLDDKGISWDVTIQRMVA